MLQGELYTLENIQKTPEGFSARVRILPESAVYAAHFPGNPITPGVCIVQTATEIISAIVGRKMDVRSSKNIKFIAPILPDDHTNVEFQLHQEQDNDSCRTWIVNAYCGQTLSAKLNLTLK